MHNLALKIVRGNYNPIPTHYSRELKNILNMCLQTDMNKRPSINKLLKQPLLQNRIKKFLGDTIKSSEFSHTVLHK